MTRTKWLSVFTLVVLAVAAGFTKGAPQGDRLTADVFTGFELRSIGPTVTTGRVADIEVDPKNPSVYYAATAVGGLWKSENRGITWNPVTDGIGAFNMCCVVVDPKDSNVVWLGTGENSNPRSAMYGDGVYKSTDAAKTWTRVGLEKSEHIGKILIDPRNSNVVYVAAQGPLWSEGGERGLYKTTDGGKTWTVSLQVSKDSGANDMVFDPWNPDIIYATTWQRRRAVGQFVGGGPESAVYKTIDAGKNWTKLTKGLPQGDMGRIAIAVDFKTKPTRVYVLANALAPDAGFYRSDDAGVTFARTGVLQQNAGRGGRGGAPQDVLAPPRGGGAGAQGRGQAGAPPAAPAQPPQPPQPNWYDGGDPGYYHELIVDPIRPDTIWSVDTNLEWSRDGGKTWSTVPNMNGVHVDFHDVWPNPNDRRHIIVANDGGVYETWDEGQTWRFFSNLPVTQFYRVSTDNAVPFYNVCGGAQDNGSVCGPHRTQHRVGIRTSDWYTVGGGDGFQTRNDWADSNIVYATSQGGMITRLDLRTGQSQGIRPRAGGPGPGAGAGGGGAGGGGADAPPARGGGGGGGGQGGGRGRGGVQAERANWDAPYIVSPHNPKRLYWASNFVYRSDDRGDSWTRISPDLSRALDPTLVPIMGKVWDPLKTVSWGTATTALSNIVSIDESPIIDGLLYVGTDDGLLQVTEDAGKNWRKVEQFPGVPAFTYVADVFASDLDPNTVFVALNNWQRGDFKPYVVKSTDRGRTFTSVAGNLPDRQNVYSIAQDFVNPSLLFAGTEFGLFFSVDGGQKWVQLKGGLPTVQVRDMSIQHRENDLVLGTFGRSFWVLDDYSPLREVSAAALGEEARLFPLRDAYQFPTLGQQRAVESNWNADNPAYGAVFTYHVRQDLPSDAKLVITITDPNGRQVRRIDLQNTAGLRRIAWNLTADAGAAAAAPGGGRGGGGGGGGGFGGRGGGPQGPPVALGRYTATLGKMVGETVTPIGPAQAFSVVALGDKH
jgi:photosystem II stability/assembly factor-like uncharacterized protein